MYKPKLNYINFAIILVIFSWGLLFFSLLNSKFEFAEILGTIFCGSSPCVNNTNPPVTVSAVLRVQNIEFTVYPEKRIPPTNNWGTQAELTFASCNSNFTKSYPAVPTNNQGTGTLNIPINDPLPGDDYSIYVTGLSHLREGYNCYNINTTDVAIDLTAEGKELLAGETSVNFDNYINALDMSKLINDLFSGDNISDLNQDGKVNSLDYSNQLYNIYESGD